MQLKSPMQYQFSQVPQANIERSSFMRSWSRKMTLNENFLYPIWCDEVIPGDTFTYHGTIFCRLQSLVQPILSNLWIDTFYFFVPNRLLWDHWVNMMGERKPDPDSSIDYSVPQIVAPAVTGWPVKSLSDYLGLPTGVPGFSVSALWHRAYNLIYNEWFRSQDLQDSVVVDTDDADSDNADYQLLKRTKRHDYFTSCLPAPSKGPGIDLPLSGNAPIKGIGAFNQDWTACHVPVYETGGTAPVDYGANNVKAIGDATDARYFYAQEDPDNPGYPGFYADLSSVGSASINDLRMAFQLQRLLERDARSGTRYVESIKAHYGVTNPDFRLQRPEFLGGNSTLMMVTPVAQTSASVAGSPQANLAAFATGASRGEGFVKSFTEHGVILALVSIRADLTYQQGCPRMFKRESRYDFYLPVLAHLGEQAVLNQEIFTQAPTVLGTDGVTPENEEVFGYNERWSEMKYKQSEICGELRSTYVTPLDSWHLAQEFADLPKLDVDFITENVPVSRVVAVTTQDHFILDSEHQCKTVRPMPLNCVPGMIDHF